MMVFIAFLAGFFFGAFATSIMVAAGRRSAIEREKENMRLLEQPNIEQMALF